MERVRLGTGMYYSLLISLPPSPHTFLFRYFCREIDLTKFVSKKKKKKTVEQRLHREYIIKTMLLNIGDSNENEAIK